MCEQFESTAKLKLELNKNQNNSIYVFTLMICFFVYLANEIDAMSKGFVYTYFFLSLYIDVLCCAVLSN